MFTIKDVHTVKSLNLPSQSLDMKEIKAKYPYMDGIPIQSYTNAKPSIIIGVDNWKVAVPLKIREGLWGQPIATKTRLGWAIQGYNGGTQKSTWLNIHTCDCERKYNELHQLIKDNFHLEATPEKSILSKEDAKSIELLKNSCRKCSSFLKVIIMLINVLCVFKQV